MMLLIRNRLRALTKPPFMPDHHHTCSPHPSPILPFTPSLFPYSFPSTPSSFFHTKPFISPFTYPFSFSSSNTKTYTSSIHRVIEFKNIGLPLLIPTLNDEPNKGNVLFRTQLRFKTKDSEEYTCVISHHGRPNTTTTHIFNNCFVHESSSYFANSECFLSFCYTCNKHLDHTKDIFIYRGEKAFCSNECRYKEMMLDQSSESDTDTHS